MTRMIFSVLAFGLLVLAFGFVLMWLWPRAEPPPDETQTFDVDQLRSLPYLAYSKKKAEDDRQGVVTFDALRSFPGYNLYSNRNLCRADLVSGRGRILRTWQDSRCRHWTNCAPGLSA